MKYLVPYGQGFQVLETDDHCQVLESRVQAQDTCEEDSLVRQAMAAPIASPTLRELAIGKQRAVLILSDHTRPVPSRRIVPYMLEEIRAANPSIQITLLVATGCHRGITRLELEAKLGREIVEREHIAVHDCDASPMVDLGLLPSGARLVLNELVAKADLVVAEGFIEPHFFAGFSGGRKSILPGVCSRVTVLGNPCASFIDSPFARMGVLDGNPIHADMEAAVQMAGLQYIVNVVIDSQKKVVAAFAGDPIRAHRAGCEYLQERCAVEPEQKGDIVITSNGGAPLDQNVYQAVKGLTTAEAAAAKDAVLIICAECADGIGGERFFQALAECRSASQLLDEIRAVPMEKTVPDQWQYQILARILEKHRVLFVTRPELAKAINSMKMEYAGSLAAAYAQARAYKGGEACVTIIPDGVSLIIR